MAAVTSPADKASSLLQKLSLDSQSKPRNGVEGNKKPSNVEVPNFPATYDRSLTPVPPPDPSMFYMPNGYAPPPYYYGGYDGPVGKWNQYSPYSSIEGMKMPTVMHGARSTSGIHPAAPDFVTRMYPYNQLYSQYGNTFRHDYGYGYNYYDSRINGRWGPAPNNKYKPSYRGYGLHGYSIENYDSFAELNRGPRAGHFQNPKALGPTVKIAVRGQNLASVGNQSIKAEKEQYNGYNREDFPDKYDDAKFFIIKSYSEDDIHKSIKYNVWASTPSGNKKLDTGYQEALGKSNGCPVFLFFSVNTSGQFVGIAEMVGSVDFNKTVEHWQQDKWIGCFPVKWHFVKDVPNNLFKHITLENNENRPVTNSRDTQEVKLEPGLQMLKIFKEYAHRTSILDDFGFYENREKLMQEKRSKQQHQKQVGGKTSDAVDTQNEKDGDNTNIRWQKPFKPVCILKKVSTEVETGKQDQPEYSNIAALTGISLEVAKP